MSSSAAVRVRKSSSPAWMVFLQVADLRHHGVSITAGCLELADLFGERIAARLLFLDIGLQSTDGFIEIDDRRSRGGGATTRKRTVEGIGMVTQPFEIKHRRHLGQG